MLVAATTAYQTDDFVAAAERLGIDVAIASDRCHVLAETWREGSLPVEFRDPDRAAEQIALAAAASPIRGLIPTDEATAVIAARAAARLGLPHNPIAAAQLAGDKLAFRRAVAAAGLPQPAFREVSLAPGALDRDAQRAGDELGFPVVVKPLALSASRGVMRADDAGQLAACLARLARLLSRPEIASDRAIVEAFVPGPEMAFEGLLSAGALATLAVFDKPEPLDGPFFAETIYVTPPLGAPGEVDVAAIARAVAAAAAAIGLCEGPVHAELRLGWGEGPVVIELAARSIGGLCGRALAFSSGLSLEEVILLHAAGEPVEAHLRAGASGVLMLPVELAGVLVDVHGAERARQIDGIVDVTITARPGDVLVPLPEGHTYVGFVFARAERPEQVVAALSRARAELAVEVRSQLPATR